MYWVSIFHFLQICFFRIPWSDTFLNIMRKLWVWGTYFYNSAVKLREECMFALNICEHVRVCLFFLFFAATKPSASNLATWGYVRTPFWLVSGWICLMNVPFSSCAKRYFHMHCQVSQKLFPSEWESTVSVFYQRLCCRNVMTCTKRCLNY